MDAACTASPNITHGIPPGSPRVIGTERPLCVEDTTLNSALATKGSAIRMNPPEPAANVSSAWIPTIPRIMSLGFEVEEIVTLTRTEQGGEPQLGVVPLFVAGDANEGSKGLAVFAPLMPHTTNPITVDEAVVWTVTVSPTRAVEAMAHHSVTTPILANGREFLTVKLRPLAVGNELKEEPVELAKTIITSFGLLVENAVEAHDERPTQDFEPDPSIDRLGVL